MGASNGDMVATCTRIIPSAITYTQTHSLVTHHSTHSHTTLTRIRITTTNRRSFRFRGSSRRSVSACPVCDARGRMCSVCLCMIVCKRVRVCVCVSVYKYVLVCALFICVRRCLRCVSHVCIYITIPSCVCSLQPFFFLSSCGLAYVRMASFSAISPLQ
jgi:hypothetical protein